MASLKAAADGAVRYMTALNAKIVSNIKGRESGRKTQDVFSAFFEAATGGRNVLWPGPGRVSQSIASLTARKTSLTARKASLTARKTGLTPRKTSLTSRKTGRTSQEAGLRWREAGRRARRA